jgi:hypothetical protein
MSYMYAHAACIACGCHFWFNPDLVPSIRVNKAREFDPTGTREPVCERCVARWNDIRRGKGLEPIQPLPGAYEPAPCD